MQSRFKPKFWRDINKVKHDKELMSVLYRIFTNIENSETVRDIHNIKQLVNFKSRYRIRLSLDNKRDYRIGLYIHGKAVWFARFLHRNKIYDENW